ncbi:MAG: hypothetical protein M1821_007231 [Bathelium mastoideum]|nr:MAG: hypothetical protein M1821_007231 [Bathelium mastoideum]
MDDSIYSDPSALFQMIGAGREGGLPMPSIITPTEVRSKSQTFSSAIFESWSTLEAIIERHEATIRRRWLKKTREQRKKILLAVWPGMAAVHRPDIDAFKKKKNTVSQVKTREAYMWPYVNLDDLSKPKLFLMLLNARARNQPFAFARADIDACRLGITSQAVVPGFLNEHVMMFTGRTDRHTYGELIAWEDHPDAFTWMHTQRGAHPGEGLLILEIQERLYSFLANCCKDILRDMTEAAQTGSDASSQPEPPSISCNDLGLGSLAASTAEAPYRVPAELNLERLKSIISAKLLSAEDHVWALREDPGYFASVLQEYKDHRQEMMIDVAGKKHPLLANPTQEEVLWGRIIQNSIVAALVDIEIWGNLLDKIVNLQNLAAKYAAKLDPEKDLPEDFAMAFYTFHHHLGRYTKGPIDNLKVGFVASPPMRPFFHREPQIPGSNVIRVMKRAHLKDDSTRDLIIWIFMTLFDEQQLHLVGLSTLMDELERVQNSDPKAKEVLSPWVVDQISSLAILSHCRHQVELYQPWAAIFEDEMASRQKEIEVDLLHTQRSFETYLRTEIGPVVISLGNPHGGAFHYPVNKRKTRENIEAMRVAEGNLDSFWHELDGKLRNAYASSPRVKILLSERILERTPQWVEPDTRPAVIQPANARVEYLVNPLSRFHFDSKHDVEIGRNYQQPAKTKIKTRGAASTDTSSNKVSPMVASETPSDQQPRFAVDKRAMKVFATIFYRPSASSQPGEIPWHDFVHALCSTGFLAEKLYGSVWQFTPQKLDVERNINFHEPHPSGRIPFLMARRHGRRLNRTYGWHGGMFVLESSKGGQDS